MIQIDVQLTQIPNEMDVQELIDYLRAMIVERYGIDPEVHITDTDLVNILKVAQNG